MTKNTNKKTDVGYGYYSRVLNKPFDSIEELKAAEDAYYAEQKAKEDKAATKKADAQKVEDAFKALNASRKTYKEELTQLTTEYSNALTELKKAFELGKQDIKNTLAAAEDAYAGALKEFTAKHDQYHLTLKDGDFETTISGSTKVDSEVKKPTTTGAFDIFDLLFGL
jgi:chromosome segregation ATPase